MTYAIRVENLSKSYRISHQSGDRAPYRSLREDLARWATAPWRAFSKRDRSTTEEFWALKDISFDVAPGEVLGIIGRNGAGKSTLLKILSRITEPTSGRIRFRGRVGSLLEVGTGFHPELTGRENIFLSGAVLGMSRAEVIRKFDEIVAFAEIDKFLDTPAKRYSSGMYMRLAFAVAAHLEPEILLVDEVLAVGDAAFQKKCLGKMGEVARGGRTVLLVSHNLIAVRGLCERAVWLDQGKLRLFGPTGHVADSYNQTAYDQVRERTWTIDDAPKTDLVRLRRASIRPDDVSETIALRIDRGIRIEFEYESLTADIVLGLTLFVYTTDNVCAFADGVDGGSHFPGLYHCVFSLPPDILNASRYYVKLMFVKDNSVSVFFTDEIFAFEAKELHRQHGWYGSWPGIVRPKLKASIVRIENPQCYARSEAGNG